MKKIFSLIFVALLTMSAWADTTVVVDFNDQGWESNTLVTELTIDDVSLTFDKGTGGTKPTYYTNTSGGALRLYGGNTMKIKAPQNLLKIDFTFLSGEGSNDIFATPGNYNKAGKQWTIGSSDPSTEVLFTIDGTSGHRRIQKLEITMEDAEPVTELVAPVFNPDGGEFTGSLEVTLSCATQNASIFWFYGTEEDQGVHNYYNGPIYLTETATLTAYSTKGNEISEYVTVTFTKKIETLAQANGLEDNTEFTFGGDAVVTLQKSGYLFLRDNSGYGMISGTVDGTFENGQVLSQGWNATKTSDNGWVRYTDATDLSASGETNAELAAVQVATSIEESMINAYVCYQNVTFSMFQRKITLPDGTAISIYDLFGINMPGGFGPDNRHWNVYGVIGIQNGALKFCPAEWVLYVEPESLRGDVDNDGDVDIDDVTRLIDVVLGKDVTYNADAADCNTETGDGSVDIDDVTALINRVLTGSWD